MCMHDDAHAQSVHAWCTSNSVPSHCPCAWALVLSTPLSAGACLRACVERRANDARVGPPIDSPQVPQAPTALRAAQRRGDVHARPDSALRRPGRVPVVGVAAAAVQAPRRQRRRVRVVPDPEVSDVGGAGTPWLESTRCCLRRRLALYVMQREREAIATWTYSRGVPRHAGVNDDDGKPFSTPKLSAFPPYAP